MAEKPIIETMNDEKQRAAKQTATTAVRKKKRRFFPAVPLPWVLAACSIITLAAALLLWQMGNQTVSLEAGTTISDYEDMTREEIQNELSKTARENRMIISAASRAALDENGFLRVNIVNDESNHVAQRFSLIQDDEVLYESGAIEPGKTLEFCHVADAKEGKAALEIQAVDSKTLQDRGNPTRIGIDIVKSTAD